MSLYGLNTSYMQNPFVMQMPFTSTFVGTSYSSPLYGGAYPSIFGNIYQSPITSVFDCSTFGYTPTTESCYVGQTGINPPYNIYPYPINTVPQYFSVPYYTPQFNFGSLTGNFNIGQNFNSGQNTYANYMTGVFGSILAYNLSNIKTNSNMSVGSLSYTSSAGSSTWTPLPVQYYNNNKYDGKNTSVNRALELAVAELGTSEVGNSNDSQGIRKYKNGAKNNLPWCASFVSWLYGSGQGSNNNKTFGYSMHSQTIRRRAQKSGYYASKNSGYKPKPGDLMIIKKSENSGHIGIVTKVYADGSFDTIEGNQSNKVKRVHRTMNTAQLDGFVRMDDWLKAA